MVNANEKLERNNDMETKTEEEARPEEGKPEAEKNMAVLDDRNVRIVRIEKVELHPKGHQLIEGSMQIIKEF